LNQPGQTSDGRGGYRHFERHRFQDDIRQPFAQAAHREDIERLHEFPQVRTVPQQSNAVAATKVCDAAREGVVLIAGGERAYLLLGAGLAGALTTFSAFAADLDVMRGERRWAGLGVYAVLTVGASLAAVAAGAWVGATIAG
jgi:hypothetical protein